MMFSIFILDKKHNVVPCLSIAEWAEWADNFSNRIVKKTKIGELEVSTIFLPLTLEQPYFFETVVFGSEEIEIEKRYKTWDEAVKGHDKIVKELSDAKIN